MNNLQELPKFTTSYDEEFKDYYHFKSGKVMAMSEVSDELNKQAEENEDLKARIAELELWIECAIKPDLQIPEWVRVSATSLLRRSDA